VRAFLTACLVVFLIGTAGYFALDALQQPSGLAFTTIGARINPDWSWRTALTGSAARDCEPRKVWQWFYVDFRHPTGEPRVCSDSQ
jgi:hypothetical protein